ncbi:methylated-DNA--[protein]-cysteine S-methyltransferase [Flagellimonas crocea]|uniref:methylated-DNA--[protein]-cysteine S-methyltransferase n=1 Tax=Flagellimonas crocea TaxID=3067311 RepID=UPI00296EE352|nr:methylated-DNA--[protein]-cysteine S-methyltransferase [Muricauda sp. DH64]
MEDKKHMDFKRIELAIGYIRAHFKEQPNLDEVADHVHLSSFHFQRIFKEWAGISPKKFLQFLNISYAKKILRESEVSIAQVAYETGLSSTGRLYDLFINIEGMTPGEYKNGGEHLLINYSFAATLFGEVLIASTKKGVCHLSFVQSKILDFNRLKQEYPKATFRENHNKVQENALLIFSLDWGKLSEVKLHLKGTPFQLKVWETLIKIPEGSLLSYGRVASMIGEPKASKAVGSAIGSNPIAFLIPCHRVIKSTGEFGEYKWGSPKKTALIGWEAAQNNYWSKT